LSLAITPPGGTISFNFWALTVKAQDQPTNTGSIPITIKDTRNLAQGWTTTCQISRDFEMITNPLKKLVISQRMTNQPQNIQNSSGQSTNLTLGTNSLIPSVNSSFFLPQAGFGSGAGSTVINTNLQYSLPSYSLVGQYQTTLICTVI
jgi:hypothetical protein